MELFESIDTRKSNRKFKMEILPDEVMQKIKDAIENFCTLYDDVKLKYRFVNKVKGRFSVDAPHYIVISGEGKDKELEAAGFLFEQLILWFNLQNIGSVWLGMSKDVLDNNANDIVTIAFGYSTEEVQRNITQFKRKDINEITNDVENIYMKKVLVAPSGMNLQPWYFEKTDNKILVYKQEPKFPISKIYKLTDLDIGIALCHYMITCKHFDTDFKFTRLNDDNSKKGFELFGSIT